MPNKPEPLFINGRYHFSLSSYDPVKVTMRVPYVTDTEIGMGLRGVLEQAGYDRSNEEPPSDKWVAEHFEGFKTLDELRGAVEQRQKEINSSYAENSKQTLCVDALAERLEQSVPEGLVRRAHDSLLQGYEDQVARGGLELSQVLAGMGMSEQDFSAMLSSQAVTLAQQEAALDAFAEEFALYADETELPGILGVSPAQAKMIADDARKHHDFDDLIRHAVRCKAVQIVASEAEVSYEHETPEEAEERVAKMIAERESWTFPDDGGCCGCGGGHGEGECCGGDCGCDGEGGCGCGEDGDCCCGHEDGHGACGSPSNEHPRLKLV